MPIGYEPKWLLKEMSVFLGVDYLTHTIIANFCQYLRLQASYHLKTNIQC